MDTESKPGAAAGPVASTALAKLLNVTPKTVQNWAKQGLSSCRVASNADGHALYDPILARAWMEEHKPAAANRHLRPIRGPRPGAKAEPAAAVAAVVGVVVGVGGELKKFGVGSVDEILAGITAKGLTVSEIKNAAEILKAALDRCKLDQELGKLVDAAGVRSSYGRALMQVKLQLSGLPGRFAGEAVGLGVAPEKELELRGRLEGEMDRIFAMLKEPLSAAAA